MSCASTPDNCINDGEKLFSAKLHEYLLEQPDQCDVTFSVGPAKEKIGAVRLILVAASLEFRKLFEEKWDLALMKKYNGIPIQDVDAESFKIFLKLLPSEHTTIEDLDKYEFNADQILNLTNISKRFGMGALNKTFEEMSKPFFKFDNIVTSPQFLKLSAINLANILSSDDIPLEEIEIFSHVCTWAKHQCSEQNLEATQENLRLVLGDCLQEIRFPLIDIKDFGKIVCAENILTDAEVSRIFRFISLDEEERNSLDISSLGFKCNARKRNNIVIVRECTPPPSIATIHVYKDFNLISNPSFTCNGDLCKDWISVDKKIQLHGIAFPGPANCDGEYIISVEVKSFSEDKTFASGKMEQIIQAKYQQPIQFLFEKPFVCNPADGTYTYNVGLFYNLRGPSMQMVEKFKDIALDVQLARNQDDVKFRFRLQCKQVLELMYTKM